MERRFDASSKTRDYNFDMVNTADAYGAELWDYFKTKDDKRELVERDDDFIDGSRNGYGGSVYLFPNTKIGLESKRKPLSMRTGMGGGSDLGL
jgi:hypothetical protein